MTVELIRELPQTVSLPPRERLFRAAEFVTAGAIGLAIAVAAEAAFNPNTPSFLIRPLVNFVTGGTP